MIFLRDCMRSWYLLIVFVLILKGKTVVMHIHYTYTLGKAVSTILALKMSNQVLGTIKIIQGSQMNASYILLNLGVNIPFISYMEYYGTI